MGEVPQPPEEEQTRTEVARERVNAATREFMTGDPAGRLRRPILFLIVGTALALNLPALGLAALLILALTDQVVAL